MRTGPQPLKLRRGARLVLAALALLAAARALGGPTGRRALSPADPAVAPAPSRPSPTPWPWEGSTVALAGEADRDGQTALLLLDPGRPEVLRRLDAGFAELAAPAWSPDGQTLAFAGRREGNWDLFAVDADGNGLRRLTAHPAYDGQPAWSPDGRRLAFVSYREGALAVHELDLAAGEGEVARRTAGEGPAIEPAWSPDGRWLAYSAWRDGGYRLEALPAAGGGEPRVLADRGASAGPDLRAPAWSPDGGRLAWLELRHGEGPVVSRAWQAVAGTLTGPHSSHAAAAIGFGWFPGGRALAVLAQDRGARRLVLRPVDGSVGPAAIDLPAGSTGPAWSRAALAPALPRWDPATPSPAASTAGASAAPQPGLAPLVDVAVPGAQINAALAEDFAALRREVRSATGQDFLGTLADAWRPLGFKSSASAFFSWHKTGRAFDTQMELWGPGRRRDLLLVREDQGGRTQWRMFLRAGAQDGSAGTPLTEAGWTFAAGSGDETLLAAGGRRSAAVPTGYWVDFSALAARFGWQRIPSIARGALDWRRNWTGIEYWHYERRDGLRWFEAASEVYTQAELVEALHPDRLRVLEVPLNRLVRLGFPAGWPDEG